MNAQFHSCRINKLPAFRHGRGFTLVELVIVMVVMGILAAGFMVFFKPTIDGYFDARRRADLTDIADTALRKMAQDIRRAVPNSINMVDGTTVGDAVACFQLVPAVGGGRYRTGPDITNDSVTCPGSGTCSKYPDYTASASTAQSFDVLISGGQAPVKDAIVVINNQNGGDVYSGASRATITNTVAAPPNTAFGIWRVDIDQNPTSTGYSEGRFLVVAQAEPSIMYSCAGGRLYRKNMASSALAAVCPADGDVLATDVQSCEFTYSASVGGTQQSGYMWMTLTVSRSGESLRMAHGSHVDNQP
jgi:MSHA biogenesis protein MshO